MDKCVIGLAGKKGSGKDTVAEILGGFGFCRIAFADRLRDVCLALDPWVADGLRLSEAVNEYGWDKAKNDIPEVRRTLQRMGTEVFRNNVDHDFWVNAAVADAAGIDRVVFSDVRYDNEAETVKKMGGLIWKVVRPGYEGDSHTSENSLSEELVDSTIANGGSLEDLRLLVSKMTVDTIG